MGRRLGAYTCGRRRSAARAYSCSRYGDPSCIHPPPASAPSPRSRADPTPSTHTLHNLQLRVSAGSSGGPPTSAPSISLPPNFTVTSADGSLLWSMSGEDCELRARFDNATLHARCDGPPMLWSKDGYGPEGGWRVGRLEGGQAPLAVLPAQRPVLWLLVRVPQEAPAARLLEKRCSVPSNDLYAGRQLQMSATELAPACCYATCRNNRSTAASLPLPCCCRHGGPAAAGSHRHPPLRALPGHAHALQPAAGRRAGRAWQGSCTL